VATFVKVVFAFVPIEFTAVKQTTMIKANITAYSTAVGPSSDFKNFFTFNIRFFIPSSPKTDAKCGIAAVFASDSQVSE
jgi:hypothetical protein